MREYDGKRYFTPEDIEALIDGISTCLYGWLRECGWQIPEEVIAWAQDAVADEYPGIAEDLLRHNTYVHALSGVANRLSNMAVLPVARRLGVGERVIERTIEGSNDDCS